MDVDPSECRSRESQIGDKTLQVFGWGQHIDQEQHEMLSVRLTTILGHSVTLPANLKNLPGHPRPAQASADGAGRMLNELVMEAARAVQAQIIICIAQSQIGDEQIPVRSAPVENRIDSGNVGKWRRVLREIEVFRLANQRAPVKFRAA